MLKTIKKREMSTEIRWINGKEEYNREEVKYMLETQRAMIYNDTKSLLLEQAGKVGLKGKLTEEGEQVINEVKNCRKVVF